jgi:hypothetical protein
VGGTKRNGGGGVTNFEKKQELADSKLSKREVVTWAESNRILFDDLAFEYPFKLLKNSIIHFKRTYEFSSNERKSFEAFLDSEFID